MSLITSLCKKQTSDEDCRLCCKTSGSNNNATTTPTPQHHNTNKICEQNPEYHQRNLTANIIVINFREVTSKHAHNNLQFEVCNNTKSTPIFGTSNRRAPIPS
eukprot:m.152138 g.152138  ORF g.152138 m.152138 type:complete len:103 (+) comp30795_c1_seq1:1852-2160(+)